MLWIINDAATVKHSRGYVGGGRVREWEVGVFVSPGGLFLPFLTNTHDTYGDTHSNWSKLYPHKHVMVLSVCLFAAHSCTHTHTHTAIKRPGDNIWDDLIHKYKMWKWYFYSSSQQQVMFSNNCKINTKTTLTRNRKEESQTWKETSSDFLNHEL